MSLSSIKKQNNPTSIDSNIKNTGATAFLRNSFSVIWIGSKRRLKRLRLVCFGGLLWGENPGLSFLFSLAIPQWLKPYAMNLSFFFSCRWFDADFDGRGWWQWCVSITVNRYWIRRSGLVITPITKLSFTMYAMDSWQRPALQLLNTRDTSLS